MKKILLSILISQIIVNQANAAALNIPTGTVKDSSNWTINEVWVYGTYQNSNVELIPDTFGTGGKVTVYNGGTLDNMNINGTGSVKSNAGSTMNNVTLDGIDANIAGTATGTTVNSSTLHVTGVIDDTIINAGSIYIDGGVSQSTVLNGTQDKAIMDINDNGIAYDTIINNNTAINLQGTTSESAAKDYGTTINTGGNLNVGVRPEVVGAVSAFGYSENALINGGTQSINNGTSMGAIIRSGTQVAFKSGVAIDTVVNGGLQHVNGGQSLNTTLNDGTVIVNGSPGDTSHSGKALAMTVNNGSVQVLSGGITESTLIKGGQVDIGYLGRSENASIYGGTYSVTGGADNDTTLNAGNYYLGSYLDQSGGQDSSVANNLSVMGPGVASLNAGTVNTLNNEGHTFIGQYMDVTGVVHNSGTLVLEELANIKSANLYISGQLNLKNINTNDTANFDFGNLELDNGTVSYDNSSYSTVNISSLSGSGSFLMGSDCSGQQKLATALEFSQYNRSDSLGVNPPL